MDDNQRDAMQRTPSYLLLLNGFPREEGLPPTFLTHIGNPNLQAALEDPIFPVWIPYGLSLDTTEALAKQMIYLVGKRTVGASTTEVGAHRRVPEVPDPYYDGRLTIPGAAVLLRLITAFQTGGRWAGGWQPLRDDGLPGFVDRFRNLSHDNIRLVLAPPDPDYLCQGGPDFLEQQSTAFRPLDSGVLCVLLAHWYTQGASLSAPIWITADAILDALGIQPRSRQARPDGHHRAALQMIAASVKRLDRLWIDQVDNKQYYSSVWNRRLIDNHIDKLLLLHDFSATWSGSQSAYAYAWAFTPGRWIQRFLDTASNPPMYLPRAFMHNYKERSWEKRLGYFLAAWFSATQDAVLHDSLTHILNPAGLPPDRAASNKKASQAKLDQVVQRLQRAGIIQHWEEVAEPLSRSNLPLDEDFYYRGVNGVCVLIRRAASRHMAEARDESPAWPAATIKITGPTPSPKVPARRRHRRHLAYR